MEEIYLAIQHIENQEIEEALAILEDYYPKASDDEAFVISDLYIQLGLLPEAKTILEALHTKYPDEAELKLVLSELYIDLEDDEHALKYLAEIEPTSDYYLQSLLTRADLYQTQGLFEVAEGKLLEAKQLAPQEVLIDFALAELSFSNGDYQKALVYYQKVHKKEHQMAEVNIDERLAEVYAQVGEFEEALQYYQSLDLDEEGLFRYGFVAQKAHRHDIAIHAWEALLDKDPEYASVYLHLADVYEEEGMLTEAFAISKKGLEFEPLNKALLLATAGLARRNGEREASYQYAREAVAVDPGYKEAVLFLNENYREDGDFEAIIDLLNHILDQGEEDPYYKWELAKAYEEEEQFEDALNSYRLAFEDLKEDLDFLKAFGYFLVEDGKIEEAKKVFESYLKLDPLDTEIETFLDRLIDEKA